MCSHLTASGRKLRACLSKDDQAVPLLLASCGEASLRMEAFLLLPLGENTNVFYKSSNFIVAVFVHVWNLLVFLSTLSLRVDFTRFWRLRMSRKYCQKKLIQRVGNIVKEKQHILQRFPCVNVSVTIHIFTLYSATQTVSVKNIKEVNAS